MAKTTLENENLVAIYSQALQQLKIPFSTCRLYINCVLCVWISCKLYHKYIYGVFAVCRWCCCLIIFTVSLCIMWKRGLFVFINAFGVFLSFSLIRCYCCCCWKYRIFCRKQRNFRWNFSLWVKLLEMYKHNQNEQHILSVSIGKCYHYASWYLYGWNARKSTKTNKSWMQREMRKKNQKLRFFAKRAVVLRSRRYTSVFILCRIFLWV